MRVITHRQFLVQHLNAETRSREFMEALHATGKVQLHVPPDSFVWTGSQQELLRFLKQYEQQTTKGQ